MQYINHAFNWACIISSTAGILTLGGIFSTWLAVELLVIMTRFTM